MYDQTFNTSFHEKLESIQYIACLALTGTIRGTSKEKLYQELSLESLQLRRWYRKLCPFYKILKNKYPVYLFNLIPARNTHYSRQNFLYAIFSYIKDLIFLLNHSGSRSSHIVASCGIKLLNRIRIVLLKVSNFSLIFLLENHFCQLNQPIAFLISSKFASL